MPALTPDPASCSSPLATIMLSNVLGLYACVRDKQLPPCFNYILAANVRMISWTTF